MPPVNLVNQRISAFGGGKNQNQAHQPQSPRTDYQGNYNDAGVQKTFNTQRNVYTTVNNGNTITTTITTNTARSQWHYSTSDTSPPGPAVTNPAYMGMGFTQNQNQSDNLTG